MTGIYTKPVVTHYAREEVEEMIGPVRTQYDCSCGFEIPTSIDETQNLEMFVRIPEECADKDSVLIRATVGPDNAQGGLVSSGDVYSLASGTPQPGGVLIDLGPAGFYGFDEQVCFEVFLFSGGDAQAGGENQFELIPPGAVGCGGDPECTYILPDGNK